MQHRRMHQAGITRLAGTGHGMRRRLGINLGRDRAGKPPIMPQRVQRSLVAAGHQLQRAVFHGHIIEEDEHSHHVHIGVRIEGKILMIFHLGARTGKLQIHLRGIEFDVGREDRRCQIERRVILCHRPEIIIHIDRRRHPPQRRRLGRMHIRLHIETRAAVQHSAIGAGMVARLSRPPVKHSGQRRHLVRRDGVLHHHIAVTVKISDQIG